MTQFMRQNQLKLPDEFNDLLTPAEIQAIEGAETMEEYFQGIISILKRIIHGDDPGDYKDDPVTSFPIDASLKGLAIRADFDENKIVVSRDSEVVVSRSWYVVRTRHVS